MESRVKYFRYIRNRRTIHESHYCCFNTYSSEYMKAMMPICRRFDVHIVFRAKEVANLNDGKRIDKNSAMIAMTTKSSISVKPDFFLMLLVKIRSDLIVLSACVIYP